MRSFQRVLLSLFALFAMSSLAHAMVRIDVDLSSQTMNVTSGDGANYTWPISSGRAGHLTPHGQFRPQRLYVMVHSAKYNNAPMPHSIFFYGQYAIHGTTAVGALGRPASHGCIRLAPANAATLFAMVQSQGAAISIVGAIPGGGAMAQLHHTHRNVAALAYAPHHRARSLKEWARDPLGNR
ncbi:L,D-transpeptidase [Methylocapsa sp. S129]|uniref:L,D-transpeptidase n=1 Tax=Methylocapsa sp. S129 TaxID=1641869 RepID=UPI00131AC7BD|nr:L,D-transpeptidase [Methylocapsa sp. S129]